MIEYRSLSLFSPLLHLIHPQSLLNPDPTRSSTKDVQIRRNPLESFPKIVETSTFVPIKTYSNRKNVHRRVSRRFESQMSSTTFNPDEPPIYRNCRTSIKRYYSGCYAE